MAFYVPRGETENREKTPEFSKHIFAEAVKGRSDIIMKFQ